MIRHCAMASYIYKKGHLQGKKGNHKKRLKKTDQPPKLLRFTQMGFILKEVIIRVKSCIKIK